MLLASVCARNSAGVSGGMEFVITPTLPTQPPELRPSPPFHGESAARSRDP
eukprot:CAMPEP_0181176676 /NCGR_PEP_ID=MMETSP1096-20121128/4757_1 /TAXON_ID=156174 ORGANISM="Chrysochromulina ericina, Strain CCMP281" /NCGR_SAMPLE_ID=MMETSP1096 /ASSEMBLY_ACC=CAM_ASM_000453 /LENGTH=50 /DNA_ID=CAMNT_0023264781 /DNA_START=513 /DNA_END=665 /DNA_ORIENTATION=+